MKEKKNDSSLFKLVVKSPFGKYKKGDAIVSPEEIEKISSSPNAAMTLRVIKRSQK